MLTELNLHPQDLAFSGLSRNTKDIFFIQIGAADGVRADPIHRFVKRFNWHGILVEPLPDLFQLLKNNYANYPGLVFENCAITENGQTVPITRVPLDHVGKNGVPGWAFGASSLVPEKTRFNPDNSTSELYETLSSVATKIDVKCQSLDELLTSYKVEKIDVLQIDTEGYDATILNQLNFEKYKPSIINMEWMWLSDDEKNQVNKVLGEHGYYMYVCGTDMLASQVNLEDYINNVDKIDPNSKPVLFPNIMGVVSSTSVGINGGVDAAPEHVEIIYTHGQNMSLKGNPELFKFILMVDGKKTISEIAQALNIDLNTVLNWVHEFIKRNVILLN